MKEKVLFEGNPPLKAVWNPLKRKAQFIKITSRRIVLTEGLIGRDEIEIALLTIRDVVMKQSALGRVFNYGEIHIRSTDKVNPHIHFYMKKPRKWREKISNLVQEEKDRSGLDYQENV
ncbi:MAG: PH domain-containing protein [Bacteroidota bacterium]